MSYAPDDQRTSRQVKWDNIARSVLDGTLIPANGWEAWEETGILDSDRVAGIIPPNPSTVLLEIGCGPGRMTRSLCLRYGKVIAVDFAPDMLRIVERWAGRVGALTVPGEAPAPILGAQVVTHLWPDPETPLPEADAAIAWNLADADWTMDELAEVVRACLRAAPFCLFTAWHEWSPETARRIAAACGNVEQATHEWALVSRAEEDQP